ncbi:hypothetical protein CCR97_17705 [Rhodoplanes elegans]|uniref:Basal-body rod modification protein FlgD n=1 Tax=Rhodoplanes elegans TaxID=29408 RepID=A0A327KVG8_9BRAD|nr:flagellar hook capping FlgD N-terminal domain-containing protein [Rhodoplanes elegans]MBK5960026.1 hypothetical protein [Rhodoplanes elegans]RAI41763.1 hypothetical protein CH338_02095 [Rhodoplanes elegans]
MSVSTVSTTTAASTTTSSGSSSTAIATDDFLKLITTQLQNQNPLDPTDTTEFTNQIMSYATFNELSSMSETLSELSDTVSALSSTVTSLYSAVGGTSA